MRSLRSRLLALWVLSLAACATVAVLLVQLSAQSTAAQVERAKAVVARSCDLIRDRFAFYATGWRGPVPPLDDAGLRDDLRTAVTLALAHQDGVEGGIWQAEAGPLAYAYPTYPGGRTKLDLPAAEFDRIRSINDQAARDEQAVARRWPSQSQALLQEACPVPGPIPGLTAWAMTRVQTSGNSATMLRRGLGILVFLVVGMTVWLGWVVLSWRRRVGRVETALALGTDETRPEIARTGGPDLDRIVAALNRSGTRLAAARQRSESLAVQVASSERLAALGRVAAGVAHEIRNPIAAIRLRAENALASGDEQRRDRALRAVLDQVARLDRLSGELLTMTQRRQPALARCDLAALVRDCAEDHGEAAATAGVALQAAGAGVAALDAALVRRALDNLVENAIRHTPGGGQVAISARLAGDRAELAVEDTGPGVPPELHASLFEPFVTSRPDGTGLGLAIARELVEAHGGRIVLDRPGGTGQGARFVIDLPAGVNDGEPPWPPS